MKMDAKRTVRVDIDGPIRPYYARRNLSAGGGMRPLCAPVCAYAPGMRTPGGPLGISWSDLDGLCWSPGRLGAS
jgi:hypothetical protein